ncbi:type II toxin-antitoxin system VapC family toxin [Rhizobium cremeum]|uniref:type II toxin-antitoxin system VapC family toxin n=1 Tax=Rhizobium cremeum TaxID=2813827 RepID=UPI001FD0B269|nr:type II toxin-antitoxin system VapC family toxin [Rhizobium cremeum]
MVIERQLGPEGMRQADAFVRRAAIGIEPVSVEQGHLARQAFFLGKGRHKAGLNFGDCFAYAFAKDFGVPLLCKGKDFNETDIRSAA